MSNLFGEENSQQPPESVTKTSRRLAVGAEVRGGEAHFRVWAPRRTKIEVVIEPDGEAHQLDREKDGYFSGSINHLRAGSLYRFRVDDGDSYPDPVARFQPDGPHGPSQIVDPSAYQWSDDNWKGVAAHGQVIYEMHIGTFTPEGTWRAAIQQLPHLAVLGITLLEVMPVHEFPGRFGWGYDGVGLFAPTRLYGSPDDLRAFVDAAHSHGLGVILDVVYNHFGPDGNFLRQFSPDYFTDKYPNDWGDAINFEGPSPVREFFVENARYWIEEFHMDGLRLDATQQIFDASDIHILADITRAVRRAGGKRETYLVAENERQDVRLLSPHSEGGFAIDSMWNDDFHHSAMVALTGRNDAYYTDYFGKPQEFISSLKWGFLYQGQWYSWQDDRRGTPSLDVDAHRMVCFIENHDQVANSANGDRLGRITDPGTLRAITTLLLLAPATPMLFQGQEFSSSAPFLYFADHETDLAQKVSEGRRDFLRQFRNLATLEIQAELTDPHSPETFERCKLDHQEREKNRSTYKMHQDLLSLRRTDTTFSSQRSDVMHGAILSDQSFLLRFLKGGLEDRLIVLNLGRDLRFNPSPEPLLAPPAGCRWELLFSSEMPEYGGIGTPQPDSEDNWRIAGRAAIVLNPVLIRK